MKNFILLLAFIMTLSVIADAQTDSAKQNATMYYGNTPTSPTTPSYPPNTKVLRRLPDCRNNLKLNLLSPFYSNLSVFYQRALDEDNSFQIGASYMDFSGVFGSGSSSSGIDYEKSNEVTKMFSITPEYRYNLTGQYLSGVYFGSFLRYMNINYTFDKSQYIYSGSSSTTVHTSESYQYNTIGLGVLVGSQLLYKRKISFDAFIGPVYNIMVSSNHNVKSNNDINIASDIPTLFVRGYGIRAGICIGFAY